MRGQQTTVHSTEHEHVYLLCSIDTNRNWIKVEMITKYKFKRINYYFKYYVNGNYKRIKYTHQWFLSVF